MAVPVRAGAGIQKSSWESGDSGKIQDCGWHLAEPMGVQPETAAAKRVGEAERRTKKEVTGITEKFRVCGK